MNKIKISDIYAGRESYQLMKRIKDFLLETGFKAKNLEFYKMTIPDSMTVFVMRIRDYGLQQQFINRHAELNDMLENYGNEMGTVERKEVVASLHSVLYNCEHIITITSYN